MLSKYFFRYFFILVLLGSAFAASLFMVLESADFYRKFYSPELDIDFGLWAAILNEVFLVIMAAVWLPGIPKGQKKVFHPGNLLIKLLMLLLFINTVGGASLNVVQDNFAKLQEEENRIATLEAIKAQLESDRTSLEAFVGQNQRLNTAIAAKNLRDINTELRELELNKKSTLVLWLDILLLTILRFTIQLANITSIWLASWLFRQPLGGPGIFHSGRLQEDIKNSLTFKNTEPDPDHELPSEPMPEAIVAEPERLPQAEHLRNKAAPTFEAPLEPPQPQPIAKASIPPESKRTSPASSALAQETPKAPSAAPAAPASASKATARPQSMTNAQAKATHTEPSATPSQSTKPQPAVQLQPQSAPEPKPQPKTAPAPSPQPAPQPEEFDDSDQSERIELAEEIVKFWSRRANPNMTSADFCRSVGLDKRKFDRVISGNGAELDIDDLSHMSSQIKRIAEMEQY